MLKIDYRHKNAVTTRDIPSYSYSFLYTLREIVVTSFNRHRLILPDNMKEKCDVIHQFGLFVNLHVFISPSLLR